MKIYVLIVSVRREAVGRETAILQEFVSGRAPVALIESPAPTSRLFGDSGVRSLGPPASAARLARRSASANDALCGGAHDVQFIGQPVPQAALRRPARLSRTQRSTAAVGGGAGAAGRAAESGARRAAAEGVQREGLAVLQAGAAAAAGFRAA